MKKQQAKTRVRTAGILIVVCAFAVLVWGFVRLINQPAAVPAEVTAFVSQEKVPYIPLLPTHLPVGARLLADSEHSHYDGASKILKLDWVFPAQTLPGQGTVLLYQADKTVSFLMPLTPERTVQVQGVIASIGDLQSSVDVPSSPGRRALSFTLDGRQIVLVSYAISDEELVKVANSLR